MSRSHRVFEWFREIGEEIQADWERLHQQAESDPQRAGHGARRRGPIILVNGSRPNTTWRPGSTSSSRSRARLSRERRTWSFIAPVIPGSCGDARGGVAAAFNVRLTLNADGIRDGVERAAEMRRYLKPRYETGPWRATRCVSGRPARALAQLERGVSHATR